MATNILNELSLALVDSFRNLGTETARVLPGLLGALILLIVGIALGIILKRIITRVLEETKVDQWLQERQLHGAIGHHKIASLVGSFTKWYVIALFLTQGVELIQMRFLRQFAQFIIDLINKGIAGVILLVVGLLLARYVRHVIESTEYQYKKTIAGLTEFLIVYVTVVMALQTLGLNAQILVEAFQIGFTVLVIALAILAGVILALAFKKDIINSVNELRKEVGK